MNKQKLIEALHADAGTRTIINKTQVQAVVEALGDVTAKYLQGGVEELALPGLGKLKVATRAARTGRNPRTGETVQIMAKRVVKFSASKALTEAVA